MHRRLRWGNVARAAGAAATVAVVVAWPRLAPPEPALPGSGAVPIARDEPEPAAPRARVREPAPGQRGRAGRGRRSGRGARRPRRDDERAAASDRRRRTSAAGGAAPGAGDKGDGQAGRATPTNGEERAGGAPPAGDDGPGRAPRAGDEAGGVPPAGDDEAGDAPPAEDDEAGGVPRPGADEDSGATPDRDEPGADPAAVEFGFEGG
jgi:hypothetical protein